MQILLSPNSIAVSLCSKKKKPNKKHTQKNLIKNPHGRFKTHMGFFQ